MSSPGRGSFPLSESPILLLYAGLYEGCMGEYDEHKEPGLPRVELVEVLPRAGGGVVVRGAVLRRARY